MPPNETPTFVDAAMRVAEPRLGLLRRRMEEARDRTAREGADAPSVVLEAELRLMEDIARVRVRRVLAALNGIDVDRDTSPWTDPWVAMPRTLAERLKAAVCNAAVYAAVEAAVGVEEAEGLVGELSVL